MFHRSIILIASTAAIAVSAAVWSPTTASRNYTASSAQATGCAAYPSDDSLEFVGIVKSAVEDTVASTHDWNLLPMLPADSVQWGGTAAQCDSVAVRYRAFRMAATGMTSWPIKAVSLLRVGPTRWVADPHVGDANGMREWVILDSSLQVLKIWRTVP